jgi:2-dehydro-3-deoxyphosphogluconate aldolase / (4S)-4-hydroxy-2-oxoglutarate aldolase
MTKQDQLQLIIESGVVAVIRSSESRRLIEVARALADGGIRIVEITFTVPHVLDVIRQVSRELGGQVLVGAGTVLDPESARSAFLSGAEFIVAPTLNLKVVRLCRRYGKVVIPGAFSPTEILRAWEAGADIVKVFPADVLGPSFLTAIRAPLPQIRLMPTGGVDLSNAGSYFKSGASCIGVGNQLVPPKAIADGNFEHIEELARQYCAIVRQARGE